MKDSVTSICFKILRLYCPSPGSVTGSLKYYIRIVKLRSRSGVGQEGQEGQIQAKSSSENSKLKDLDHKIWSHMYNKFGFHHHHPPTHHKFFLALKGPRQVRWTKDRLV